MSRSEARKDNQELAHAAVNEITCVITLASCGRDEFYEPGAFGRNAKEDIGAEQDLDDAEGCGVVFRSQSWYEDLRVIWLRVLGARLRCLALV